MAGFINAPDVPHLHGRAITVHAVREGMCSGAVDGVESVVVLALAHVAIDLTDPATLGCLLALVREAWGDPTMSTHCWRLSPSLPSDRLGPSGERWVVIGGWDDTVPIGEASLARSRRPDHRAPTEAEALIAALEAAHA